MAKFPAYHPQPHLQIEASGNMTDLNMHPLWPTSFFFFFFFIFAKKSLCKKSLNIRFIGRHILFGAFMANDSWHGMIWQKFLPIRLL